MVSSIKGYNKLKELSIREVDLIEPVSQLEEPLTDTIPINDEEEKEITEIFIPKTQVETSVDQKIKFILLDS
jgi:hypothetical protein